MTVAEGGGRRAVSHKLRDMYIPTLKANYMVWPLVQIVNFRILPLQYQLVSLLLCFALGPLLISAAVRLDSRYCVDGISFFIQRCRGCDDCFDSTSITQYPLGIDLIWFCITQRQRTATLHWTGVARIVAEDNSCYIGVKRGDCDCSFNTGTIYYMYPCIYPSWVPLAFVCWDGGRRPKSSERRSIGWPTWNSA